MLLNPYIPQFDHFHELVINQEFSRIHARGYSDGLGGGTMIGTKVFVTPDLMLIPSKDCPQS
jgi:hypothetical protein